jgi:hypothetical protein
MTSSTSPVLEALSPETRSVIQRLFGLLLQCHAAGTAAASGHQLNMLANIWIQGDGLKEAHHEINAARLGHLGKVLIESIVKMYLLTKSLALSFKGLIVDFKQIIRSLRDSSGMMPGSPERKSQSLT